MKPGRASISTLDVLKFTTHARSANLPPITAFDMGQGRRAFIWTMNSSYTMPGSTTTTGNLNVIGGTGFYSATTIASPPQTFNQQCNYTIFAERIPGAPEGPARACHLS